jgi:hypothetical protein
MPPYRVYLIGPDNHITGLHVAECEDDAAAMAQAAGFVTREHGVETWQGDRLVGQLPAAMPKRPPANTADADDETLIGLGWRACLPLRLLPLSLRAFRR